ncbi:MAG: hypothetical protein J6N70_12390, partial [Oribacterium sp.]|nr:hypothetical protein [Oribacterium sp.]
NTALAVATSQTHSGLSKVKASALRRRLSNQRLIASEQTTRLTGGCDFKFSGSNYMTKGEDPIIRE